MCSVSRFSLTCARLFAVYTFRMFTECSSRIVIPWMLRITSGCNEKLLHFCYDEQKNTHTHTRRRAEEGMNMLFNEYARDDCRYHFHFFCARASIVDCMQYAEMLAVNIVANCNIQLLFLFFFCWVLCPCFWYSVLPLNIFVVLCEQMWNFNENFTQSTTYHSSTESALCAQTANKKISNVNNCCDVQYHT